MSDKCFTSTNWVCVLDSDVHSERQLKWLYEHKTDAPLKGLVKCNEPEHANTNVCTQVPAFPTFCDTTTGKCVPGVRTSVASMEAMCKSTQS